MHELIMHEFIMHELVMHELVMHAFPLFVASAPSPHAARRSSTTPDGPASWRKRRYGEQFPGPGCGGATRDDRQNRQALRARSERPPRGADVELGLSGEACGVRRVGAHVRGYCRNVLASRRRQSAPVPRMPLGM